MASLTCNCGYKADHEDHYMVEGQMWVHAMEHHADMMKGMTAEKLADWLKEADKSMGVT